MSQNEEEMADYEAFSTQAIGSLKKTIKLLQNLARSPQITKNSLSHPSFSNRLKTARKVLEKTN